jgi:hypothetical protein
MDLSIQTSRRAEACQQRGSRLDLSNGCRESDLGSAAHSRRTAHFLRASFAGRRFTAIPNRRAYWNEKEILLMWCTTIWRTTWVGSLKEIEFVPEGCWKGSHVMVRTRRSALCGVAMMSCPAACWSLSRIRCRPALSDSRTIATRRYKRRLRRNLNPKWKDSHFLLAPGTQAIPMRRANLPRTGGPGRCLPQHSGAGRILYPARVSLHRSAGGSQADIRF